MKKPAKLRLDELLVTTGLASNLKVAQARIMAGEVIVNEHRADKPSEKFGPEAIIRVKDKPHNFVSRGALKLEHALKIWQPHINEAVCLDVGASTGGFTEMLLNHGAKLVYAVDVGYGQLAESLRVNPQVKNLERTHILHLQPEHLSLTPSIAVIDVSFISLTKILPHVLTLLSPQATIIALIKPQFEAEPHQVEPGGLITNNDVRTQVVSHVVDFIKALPVELLGLEISPITGTKGNIEYLVGMRKIASVS